MLNLKQWFERTDLKVFSCIPFLATWGIWRARNDKIFEDMAIPDFVVTSQVLALLSLFKNTIPAANASMEGIVQFGMDSLQEWKLDTKIENSEPSLLIMESTSCSSFFSIPHCLHCMTGDLNFEKSCCIVSKFLGYSAISSFSRIWPLSSSCFPNKDSSLSHTYFGVLNLSK